MALRRQDPREILAGHHAELYLADTSEFLAAINTWSIRGTYRNEDHQPSASLLEVAVPVSQRYTLSLTETCTKTGDMTLLKRLGIYIAEQQRDGYSDFGFIARLRTNRQNMPGGTRNDEEWLVLRNVVPDGDIDFQNVRPGAILTRAWNFRVNDFVDIHSYGGQI